MTVGIWIAARINRALRAAAAWASDPDVVTESVRRWAVLGALVLVCAAVLGARAFGRLVRREKGIVVLVLALAIPVAALEFGLTPGARPTNAPVAVGPTPARVTENEPAGRGINESTEENARMAAWKRSVEQALTHAEAGQPRRQDAATADDGAGATVARSLPTQEGEARRTDLGAARELAIKQAGSSNENNEDKAAAEAKAASGSSAATDANAADDAKRANETKGSEQPSDSSPIATGQDRQTRSTGGVDGWSRRTEISGATEEREVARENAIARHALVYSWVTVDRAGHRWVHIRPLHYSQ
jgi:hypothetical protein